MTSLALVARGSEIECSDVYKLYCFGNRTPKTCHTVFILGHRPRTQNNGWQSNVSQPLADLSPIRLFSSFFLARLQNCEKRLLASSCLSVRTEKLGSHWTDFNEIYI